MKYILTLLVSLFFSCLHAKIVPQTATLSNGLKVIVFQNPLLPSVSILTKYDIGTADDPSSMVGLSHMLEHMMFKGAKKYGKNYWDGNRKFGYGGYKYIPNRWDIGIFQKPSGNKPQHNQSYKD